MLILKFVHKIDKLLASIEKREKSALYRKTPFFCRTFHKTETLLNFIKENLQNSTALLKRFSERKYVANFCFL